MSAAKSYKHVACCMLVAFSCRYPEFFMVLSSVLKSYLLFLRMVCPFIIWMNFTFSYVDFFFNLELNAYFNSVYIKT